MAKTVSVPEAQARKVLVEIGEKKAKTADGKKLEKLLNKLADLAEAADPDELSEMSKPSQKLLTKWVEVLGKGQKLTIEAEEDEEEEDEAPKKKSKKGKDEKGKKAAKESDGEPSLRTQQSRAITKAFTGMKGPATIAEIVKKASKTIAVTEGRVENHMAYMVDTGKATEKKGKYSPT